MGPIAIVGLKASNYARAWNVLRWSSKTVASEGTPLVPVMIGDSDHKEVKSVTRRSKQSPI